MSRVIAHIGVHKTGTTAVQGSLTALRDRLIDFDVNYPGSDAAHHRAAMGLLGKTWGWRSRGGVSVGKRHFRTLARELRRASGTSIVSSEFFCEADDAQAATAVKAFGGSVEVVVGVRNLGYILPSSWQQYLKNGLSKWYTPWLKEMLAEPGAPTTTTATFWRRHDVGRVVSTWARAAGASNVHVVVIDPQHRDGVFRTLESMSGIPTGLLQHEDLANRSMTEAEAFTLLGINRQVKRDLDWPTYQRLVRNGIVAGMIGGRQPSSEEPLLATPDWALDRAAEIGAGFVERITEAGVVVHGDLHELARRLPTPTPHGSAPMPITAAIAALNGLVSTP